MTKLERVRRVLVRIAKQEAREISRIFNGVFRFLSEGRTTKGDCDMKISPREYASTGSIGIRPQAKATESYRHFTTESYRDFTIEQERDGTLSVCHPECSYCGGGYKTAEEARRLIDRLSA